MSNYNRPSISAFPLAPGAPSYPPQPPSSTSRSPSSGSTLSQHGQLPATPQRKPSPGPTNWTTNALSERNLAQAQYSQRSSSPGLVAQGSSQQTPRRQPSPAPVAAIPSQPPAMHPQYTPQPPIIHQQPSQSPHPPQPFAQPIPVAAPQHDPNYAAQIEYHNQLVTYYYTYAYQGLLAPAVGEQQEKARKVAVDWARGQGIVVAEPPQSSAPAPVPATPQVPPSQFVHPPQVGYQQVVQTAPLPQVPFANSTVASPQAPPPSTFGHRPPVSHPFSTPLQSVPQFPSSNPSSPIVTRKPPLPQPPSSRNFSPSTPRTLSNLTRSASLANTSSPSAYIPHSSSSSDIGIGSRIPSASVSDIGVGSRHVSSGTSVVGAESLSRPPSAQQVLARSGSTSSFASISTTRRPLPVPPGRSSTMPAPPQSRSPADLANGISQIQLGASTSAGSVPSRRPLPGIPPRTAPPPTASSSTSIAPPPVVAPPRPRSPVVESLTNSDRSRSPSPIPLFSVTSSEESSPNPNVRSPSPSISVSPAIEIDSAPPSLSTSTVTITPNASSPQRAPRLHPRHDPSHPSHYLYHPTSTPRSLSLEAGKIVCAGCGQDMFGRALMAMGKEWHPDCFVCVKDGCGVNLEHVQFDGKVREKDDEEGLEGEVEVYCMVHYEELFAIQCFHCKTPIAESEYLTISDDSLLPQIGPRTYHALHFFCANCGDPFVDPKSLAKGREGTLAKPYMAHKGHAYCFGCDVKLYQPKCAGCRKGMGGDVLEALGKQWHVDCFTCCTCQKVLDDHFLVRDYGKDNGGEKAYCYVCYDIQAKSELDY